MPTSAPAPCHGPCNTAWRRAEHRRTATGTDHDIPVTWGTPIHCADCVDRTGDYLADLPHLLDLVALEALDGQRGVPSASTHGAPTDTTPWPGQAARLLIDHIAGGLAETAATVRALHHHRDQPLRRPGIREAEWIRESVNTLFHAVDWLLQEHPLATESHEPLRRAHSVVHSGNPAAQVAHWHTAATRFTRRDRAPETKRLAPCARCGGPWLTECRDLHLIGDEPYIECQNPECQTLYRPDEYRRHVKDLVATTRLKHREDSR
ncbi:hypothetical protein FNH09_08420 [Streptomyces adustus]|uniref:Uncharacterized protein n=1 Tax=Streptomyces adustus TaxID=1609272 RepID=A0A5N8V9K2_9ACTN|nr:hypothetical protein [Streptomyces adustus]MPY31322.1 hypothetical protein [Streptomyces adustus]